MHGSMKKIPRIPHSNIQTHEQVGRIQSKKESNTKRKVKETEIQLICKKLPWETLSHSANSTASRERNGRAVKVGKGKLRWKIVPANLPGPLAPPCIRRPNRNITARSYSCTTCPSKRRRFQKIADAITKVSAFFPNCSGCGYVEVRCMSLLNGVN